MNEERLAELERLASVAKPRPWFVAWNGDGDVSGVMPDPDAIHDGEVFFARNLERSGFADDCAYIVAACNAVPELLAEVRRLRGVLAWYGDEANYRYVVMPEDLVELGEADPVSSAILDDGGDRAREALAGAR